MSVGPTPHRLSTDPGVVPPAWLMPHYFMSKGKIPATLGDPTLTGRPNTMALALILETALLYLAHQHPQMPFTQSSLLFLAHHTISSLFIST